MNTQEMQEALDRSLAHGDVYATKWIAEESLAEVVRLRETADHYRTGLEEMREELSEAALRNDRLLNVLRGEEAMRREAEASRDRLAEAIASALTSLATGPAKDGYAHSVLAEALVSLPDREDAAGVGGTP